MPRIQEELFDITKCIQDKDLDLRPDFVFPTGAIYKGQWRGIANRHGYGVQVWPDGATYVGMWENNKAHGRGHFIHADGDEYDGEWR